MAKHAAKLQRNNDTADAAHKARDNGIGDEPYVLPKPHYAEGDLQQTGEDHGRENKRCIATESRVDPRENDDHRAGRARNLGIGAAE